MSPCCTRGRRANVSPGSCSSTLNTVCSDTIGRSSIERLPSSTHPIAGPSATPSSRTLPVAQLDERLPQRRRRRSARCAGCGVGTGRCGRCRAGAASPRPGADRLGPPVVRPFRLARELALGGDVVADLGREHDVVARGEVGGEDRLARAVLAVHGRGVDEVDAGVERGRDHLVRVVGAAPPVGDERPGAEADLGDGQLAVPEAAVAHRRNRSETTAKRPTR